MQRQSTIKHYLFFHSQAEQQSKTKLENKKKIESKEKRNKPK